MIEIELWSDFACPFCYIGKTTFEKALAQFSKKDQVKLTYRSFELDPAAAKSQKVSIYEVLAKKYGQSLEWAKASNERVTQMGAEVGVHFAMEKVIPTNTFDAHRLAQLAQNKGFASQAQDALFGAYFTEGKDLADQKVLKEIGLRIGLDAKDIDLIFSSDELVKSVRDDEETASELQIQGVPFVVLNRKYGVSGAQPADAFLNFLNEASKA